MSVFSGSFRLKPQGEGISNFSGSFISAEGFVYLTTVYQIVYAVMACEARLRNQKYPAGDPVLIPVEVAESNLYPDEDFLRDEMATQKNISIHSIPYSALQHKERKNMWPESLDKTGKCAHLGAIKVDKILANDIIKLPLHPGRDIEIALGYHLNDRQSQFGRQGGQLMLLHEEIRKFGWSFAGEFKNAFNDED